MTEFKSIGAFHQFDTAVRQTNGYAHSAEQEHFLLTLLETAQSRVLLVSVAREFWRAQVGHDWRPTSGDEGQGNSEPCPFDKTRMRPSADPAKGGRVNPKGIPCLYMATDEKTAMSEVRPWKGSLVSVAVFRVVRDLKIVDCSREPTTGGLLKHLPVSGTPTPEQVTSGVWSSIDHAFARPVEPNDDAATYATTQVIAEAFRQAGYKGVAYKSALTEEGYNVALFDLDDAEYQWCKLYEVKSLRFEFEEWV